MIFKKQLTNKNEKPLFIILIAMLIIVLLLMGLLVMILNQNSIFYARILATSFIAVLFVVVILLISTVITIGQLWYNNHMSIYSKRIIQLNLRIFYPAMIVIGKVFGIMKDDIRKIYAELNNKLILADKYGITGEDILILTPHCLQKSFCPHKITHDIYNCKRCGKCDVDQLIYLKDKYNVHFKIATGGTLARKMIKEINPKVIIAIACERDLISGLQDVKKIPVIAIINNRPEGPCINTNVNIIEVEKAIKHFIKE